MKMNKFAAEVHQNAVEHGWWDEERSFGEIIALCHSELSEALEEYRAKRPMVYFVVEMDDGKGGTYPAIREDIISEEDFAGEKPEGIAVELADCIIRILDWYGKEGLDTDALLLEAGIIVMCDLPIPVYGQLRRLHRTAAQSPVYVVCLLVQRIRHKRLRPAPCKVHPRDHGMGQRERR